MEKTLNSDFVSLYINTIKPIAIKCAKGFHVMKQLNNGIIINESDEDLIRIKSSVDANAIWFIGYMLGDIEKALIEGVSLNMINSISQVHGCLNSESYWKNVWGDDFSSDEAKNLHELGGVMDKLIKLL